MPSLRRTISSPSVRSSPYPSLSSAVNGMAGSRGNGHRRSSGSETSSRRVLADIEWWRVADGQRDFDADQESEDRNRDQNHVQTLVVDDPRGGAENFSTDVGVERPSTPIRPITASSPETLQHTLPTDELAALSITPHTPTRRQHARESSSSSLESTPESAELSFDGLRLRLLDIDLGFPEEALALPPVRRRGCVRASPPFLSLRAHSFTGVVSLRGDPAGQYADFTVSPLSSHSPHLFN